ncbi:MAG: lipoprotein insertase outer membrane protein LolB [Gammaproteobacteria bacterium]|nr:lipoprotein insertase outer membrane protein LolB [Gammaproteobacteria bacterium]MCI0590063.1 lipoprotein insertase outer membrane protein LolB [Gammaproteobacteria bacterium]
MRCVVLAALAVLLTACAELPSTPIPGTPLQEAWRSHQAELLTLQHWSLTGRVAIQTEKDGWNATLRWTQQDDAYSMRVISPFGQGSYELQGSAHGVIMRTADNQTLVAQDVEALMLENLGWSVPVAGLRYWVRGIPEPAWPVDTIALNDEGYMADLQQSGWRVSVLRYVKQGDLTLPAKLFMHNARFKVRLVVENWEADPS